MLNGIGGHTTVYIHSYSGLTFPPWLTSAKLITLYMKTHYGNYIRLSKTVSCTPANPGNSELCHYCLTARHVQLYSLSYRSYTS